MNIQRAKKKSQENQKSPQIFDIMNIVQLGMRNYIPDSEFDNWTYWKLMKSYHNIFKLVGYDERFKIYTQCGDNALVKEHWSESIKL